MDTKVKQNLHIDLIDWQYYNDDTLSIAYMVDGKEKELHLPEDELLKRLDRCNIIDTFVGYTVKFSTCEDFYDPTEPDGHGQREENHKMGLCLFMHEVFTHNDAMLLVLDEEEQARIKQIATKVQNELTACLHP